MYQFGSKMLNNFQATFLFLTHVTAWLMVCSALEELQLPDVHNFSIIPPPPHTLKFSEL